MKAVAWMNADWSRMAAKVVNSKKFAEMTFESQRRFRRALLKAQTRQVCPFDLHGSLMNVSRPGGPILAAQNPKNSRHSSQRPLRTTVKGWSRRPPPVAGGS
jgi:hypothetical protein